MEQATKPLIFIGPYSETLTNLKKAATDFLENEDSNDFEIYEVSSPQEIAQLIPVIGSSLIFSSSPKKCAQMLQQNHKLIKKQHSKVILLSVKVIPNRILEKLTKIGLTESIVEPVAPKTLLYKIRFLMRSLPALTISDDVDDVDQVILSSDIDKSNDDTEEALRVEKGILTEDKNSDDNDNENNYSDVQLSEQEEDLNQYSGYDSNLLNESNDNSTDLAHIDLDLDDIKNSSENYESDQKTDNQLNKNSSPSIDAVDIDEQLQDSNINLDLEKDELQSEFDNMTNLDIINDDESNEKNKIDLNLKNDIDDIESIDDINLDLLSTDDKSSSEFDLDLESEEEEDKQSEIIDIDLNDIDIDKEEDNLLNNIESEDKSKRDKLEIDLENEKNEENKKTSNNLLIDPIDEHLNEEEDDTNDNYEDLKDFNIELEDIEDSSNNDDKKNNLQLEEDIEDSLEHIDLENIDISEDQDLPEIDLNIQLENEISESLDEKRPDTDINDSLNKKHDLKLEEDSDNLDSPQIEEVDLEDLNDSELNEIDKIIDLEVDDQSENSDKQPIDLTIDSNQNDNNNKQKELELEETDINLDNIENENIEVDETDTSVTHNNSVELNIEYEDPIKKEAINNDSEDYGQHQIKKEQNDNEYDWDNLSDSTSNVLNFNTTHKKVGEVQIKLGDDYNQSEQTIDYSRIKEEFTNNSNNINDVVAIVPDIKSDIKQEQEDNNEEMNNIIAPNSKGVEFAIRILNMYLSNASKNDILNYISETIYQKFKGETHLLIHSNGTFENFSNDENDNAEWIDFKNEHLDTFKNIKVPTWQDSTWQKKHNIFYYPFYEGSNYHGLIVIKTSIDNISQNLSDQIETILETARALYLSNAHDSNVARKNITKNKKKDKINKYNNTKNEKKGFWNKIFQKAN